MGRTQGFLNSLTNPQGPLWIRRSEEDAQSPPRGRGGRLEGGSVEAAESEPRQAAMGFALSGFAHSLPLALKLGPRPGWR